MPENKDEKIKVISLLELDAPDGPQQATAPTSSANPANRIVQGVLSGQPVKTAAPMNIGPATNPSSPSGAAVTFSTGSMKNMGTSKLLDTLVAQKDLAARARPILGNAPILQKALEQEKEYTLKKKLRMSQIVLLGVFFAAAGMSLFFYSELTPTFNLLGTNSIDRLAEVNVKLQAIQTRINKSNYLTAQIELNKFSLLYDQFLDETAKMADPTLSSAAKKQLMTDAQSAAEAMPAAIKNIRDALSTDIVAPTYKISPDTTDELIQQQAVTDLKASLTEERNKNAGSSTTGVVNNEEMRLYDNAIKLVGNNKLVSTVKGISADSLKSDLESYLADLSDAKRKALQTKLSSILTSTKSNLAIIGKIKNSRMDWGTVKKNIETVTAGVDSNFGKGLYDTFGGIRYNGYQMDSTGERIVISGNVKTFDNRNFTMMSNLIKAIEQSPYFKNPEMRSFAKGGDSDKGFTSSFSISLNMEQNGLSEKDKKISLVKQILAQKTKQKRQTK